MTTHQQEGKNDSIADENTPFRSAAGVAIAKAAVRDVRTIIIHRSSVLLFLSFFFPLRSIAVVLFCLNRPSQFSYFSFFVRRLVIRELFR